MNRLFIAGLLGAAVAGYSVSAGRCCNYDCGQKPVCTKTYTIEKQVCPEKVCGWVCPDGTNEQHSGDAEEMNGEPQTYSARKGMKKTSNKAAGGA